MTVGQAAQLAGLVGLFPPVPAAKCLPISADRDGLVGGGLCSADKDVFAAVVGHDGDVSETVRWCVEAVFVADVWAHPDVRPGGPVGAVHRELDGRVPTDGDADRLAATLLTQATGSSSRPTSSYLDKALIMAS